MTFFPQDLPTVANFINERPGILHAMDTADPADADTVIKFNAYAAARRELAEALGWTVPVNDGETTEVDTSNGRAARSHKEEALRLLGMADAHRGNAEARGLYLGRAQVHATIATIERVPVEQTVTYRIVDPPETNTNSEDTP